jgi:hypothetical protein
MRRNMSATVKIRVYLVMQAPSSLPKGFFSRLSIPSSAGNSVADRTCLLCRSHPIRRPASLENIKRDPDALGSLCSPFSLPLSLSLSFSSERFNGLTSIFFGASARGYSPPLPFSVLFNTFQRDFATWNREDGSAPDKIDGFNGRPRLDTSPASPRVFDACARPRR